MGLQGVCCANKKGSSCFEAKENPRTHKLLQSLPVEQETVEEMHLNLLLLWMAQSNIGMRGQTVAVQARRRRRKRCCYREAMAHEPPLGHSSRAVARRCQVNGQQTQVHSGFHGTFKSNQTKSCSGNGVNKHPSQRSKVLECFQAVAS